VIIAVSCFGYLYDQGKGVEQDYCQAMKWYLKAAYMGLAKSQYNVGVLFKNREGVEQDYHQAMR